MNQQPEYFHNPYNFVRPLWPPVSAAGPAALLGRYPPPPRDRATGYSGVITCRVTTVTPLFVPDAEHVEVVDDHPFYPFLKVGARSIIPGSSVRGAVRSIFETVTNSCFAVFDPEYVVRRPQGNEAQGYIPGRIEEGTGGRLRVRLLRGHRPAGPGGGNLQRGAWLPISLANTVASEMSCWAVLPSTACPWPTRPNISLRRVEGIIAAAGVANEAAARAEFAARGVNTAGKLVVQGYAHINGYNISGKHDERLFYDALPTPEYKDLNPLVVERYNKLISNYREAHVGEVDPPGQQGTGVGFSRFITAGDAPFAQPGRLVYVKLTEGDTGEVEYLAPVALPRLLTASARRDLLERLNADLLPCGSREQDIPLSRSTPPELCPACRVFGWTLPDSPDRQKEREAKKLAADAVTAVAGRVAVSHARQVQEGQPAVWQSTPLAILSTPKPSASYFYIRPRRGRPPQGLALQDYGYDGDPRSVAGVSEPQQWVLRGRKFYRRQSLEAFRRWGEYRPNPNGGNRQPEHSDQNRTAKDMVGPGAVFEFTVRFSDLQPVELGALLWSLAPFGGAGALRLGYGKPLGLGVTRPEIVQFSAVHAGALYGAEPETTAGGSTPTPTAATDPAPFIAHFQQQMEQAFGRAFNLLTNVRDLRALLCDEVNDVPVTYPRVQPYALRNNDVGPQVRWWVDNKREGNNGGPHLALDVAAPGPADRDCVEQPLPFRLPAAAAPYANACLSDGDDPPKPRDDPWQVGRAVDCVLGERAIRGDRWRLTATASNGETRPGYTRSAPVGARAGTRFRGKVLSINRQDFSLEVEPVTG